MATPALFDIGNVILEPAPTFGRLKERTRAWLPLLATMVLTLAVMVWWVQTTDFAWLREHVAALNPDIKPEQKAAMQGMMTPKAMMVTSSLGVLIGTPLMFAIVALYYFLAGKLIGEPISYGKWFGFAAWTSIPRLLALPLSALQIVTSHGQVALEDLNMVSLNYLVFHLPASNHWAGLLNSIDLPSIWGTVLAVIGLKVWTGRPTATCVTVAVIPWVVVYGVWAAKIAFLG